MPYLHPPMSAKISTRIRTYHLAFMNLMSLIFSFHESDDENQTKAKGKNLTCLVGQTKLATLAFV